MISHGIRISWRSGPEYVPVDLIDPSRTVVSKTFEFWKSEGTFVQYKTQSRVTALSDGMYKIEVFYLHELNPAIPYEDVCWGRSEISLKAGDSSGEAKWIDSYNKKHNGVSQWTSLQAGLIGEKRRETTTKLSREQAMFRSALLGIEPRCAITGEETSAALEAAHIIPASNGGREVIENGLLLRSDLHRLYDSGHFRFSMSGKVERIKGVSSEYGTLLKGKRLSKESLSRVMPALELLLAKEV